MAPRKTSALSSCLFSFIISGPFFVKGTICCRSKPGKEICSSTESMFCHPDQHPQIIEAYFDNDHDHTVCETNCKPLQIPDGAFQCLANPTLTKRKCVQRLNYTDLDAVYNTCEALSRNCTFGDLGKTKLSLRSSFNVHYYCIQENSTIDPCLAFEEQRSHASLWLPYSTTSCHSVCEITPNDTKRLVFFKYQLIETLTRSDETMVSENNITFEITFTPNTQNGSEWGQFHSSYYDDYKQWQGVDKIRIRFNIPRGDVVRLLWISINGIVKITCRPTVTNDSSSPSTTGRNGNTPRSGSANTASSTPDSITSVPGDKTTSATESGNREGDQNPTLVITIVAVVLGVAALVLVVVTVFIIRKRCGRQRGKLNAETKGDNNERHPDNQTNASLPSPNYGDFTQCFVPGDSNPDPAPPRDPEAEAVMTAHHGCDVGDEYGHLQRDARVGMAGGSEESENYDHMPVVRPRSDVYNVLQREQKKQEVVDNVYNTTSLN